MSFRFAFDFFLEDMNHTTEAKPDVQISYMAASCQISYECNLVTWILFLFCGSQVTNSDFQKNISKLAFKENLLPSEAAKYNTL